MKYILQHETELPVIKVSSFLQEQVRDLGCILAITFHCSFSNSTETVKSLWDMSSVVKMSDFEFDRELLMSLLEARPMLWDKTDERIVYWS
jgi:hypothetical protein